MTTGTNGSSQRNESPGWAAFVVIYLLFLAAVLVSALVQLWPLVHGTSAADQDVHFVWGLFTVSLNRDTGLIVLAALAGGLGAFVHASTSVVDYLGNRRFVASWTSWYIVRLPIGAALAVLFYFVVRAGFLSTDASSTDVSPFGIAALGGLAGLFSKQATDKMREVFEALFKVDGGDADRGDSLANPTPKLNNIDPTTVKPRSGPLELRVTGQGFVEHSVVRVDRAEQPTTFKADDELRAQLPADLFVKPAVLAVTVASPEPGGGTSEPKHLHVTDAGPRHLEEK